MRATALIITTLLTAWATADAFVSEVWVADCGDGTYANPVINADYSDPDAIRVGDYYYMTASSFSQAPGLPILYSRDLVNWEIVNNALARLVPEDFYAIPRHGKGVWAPSIRHHKGEYYIFWGDPDFGVYMVKTDDPLGRWSEPTLVWVGKGIIDPVPLWDDDGKAYLVNAWAARHGGEPALRDIAVRHAETTMRHHFHPDATCYHVAVYDTVTGDFLRGCTHQGYSDSSVWARGQAWAVYGYTVVYRETRDPRFLDFAQRVADAYLKRLPADGVPSWDFDDPHGDTAPRDASAACVVASALLELCGYVEPEKGAAYRDAAEMMLATLSSDRYRAGADSPAFLLHSTGNHPAGSEIDASIIYADYYYLEALERLTKRQEER